MTQAHRLRMARLARLAHCKAEAYAKLAEVESENAKVFSEMAEGETVDLRTGRSRHRAHEPKIPTVTETDRARARAALHDRTVRRRLAP